MCVCKRVRVFFPVVVQPASERLIYRTCEEQVFKGSVPARANTHTRTHFYVSHYVYRLLFTCLFHIPRDTTVWICASASPGCFRVNLPARTCWYRPTQLVPCMDSRASLATESEGSMSTLLSPPPLRNYRTCVASMSQSQISGTVCPVHRQSRTRSCMRRPGD